MEMEDMSSRQRTPSQHRQMSGNVSHLHYAFHFNPLLPAAKQRRSMDHNWPLFVCLFVVRFNHLKEAFTGQRSMET